MSQRFDPAGSKCLGGAQPGAAILMDATIAYFPPAYNLGIYVCRLTRDGKANSVHSEGRAGDSGFRLKDGKPDPQGLKCAEWLVANSEVFGVQTVIWNRRIWSLVHPYWRAYTGPHPHDNHVHWELNWWGAKNLTRSVVEAHRPGTTPPQEDPDMPKYRLIRGHPDMPGHVFIIDGCQLKWMHDPQTAADMGVAVVRNGGVAVDIAPGEVDVLEPTDSIWSRLPVYLGPA